jgi:hypothetical protein
MPWTDKWMNIIALFGTMNTRMLINVISLLLTHISDVVCDSNGYTLYVWALFVKAAVKRDTVGVLNNLAQWRHEFSLPILPILSHIT